ncbi:ParB/RepB/Spo0J family partition protein [Mitsuokella multacida]|jgi:ParB family chromosome partitioning protein|uniref:ParB/RepB/Spo0J family partition protein n=1 Tax=Mitsuokella multacida TaxID=52226 RepID=A0A414NWY6_9FIRM|nr:ParB/RepB/Spo0J family partition protein [Mitsuokella multacida]RHF51763.1 ParB/RepB/Spo0J family partition protein [Mitsuokella multacida]
MVSKGHGGLGKGLGALLKNREITPAKDQVQEIAADEIRANRYQPRQNFDEAALEDLSESIRQYGILQPLIVRRLPEKGYELIAGERRLRAARKAGLEKVPALVREYNDAEISEIALIENIQRENLNIIEEAEAYAFLMQNFQLTQEMLAKKVGRSRPHIANSLRLLELAEPVQDKLIAGELLMGQARPLLALKDEALQVKASEHILAEHLSSRQAEELVRCLLDNPAYLDAEAGGPEDETAEAQETQEAQQDAFYQDAVGRLNEYLGTKVRIRPGKKKSRIEIEFYSEDDLERLLELLEGQKDSHPTPPEHFSV